MGHRVSAALCHKRGTSAIRLPGATSIFNAELHAYLLALDVVRRSKEKHFLLLSDSYSSLNALGGSHVDQDAIYKYLKTYSTLTNSGKTVIFCWIPGHVGIPGNKRADRVAKAALSFLYLLSRYQPWTSSHAPNYLCAKNDKKYGRTGHGTTNVYVVQLVVKLLSTLAPVARPEVLQYGGGLQRGSGAEPPAGSRAQSLVWGEQSESTRVKFSGSWWELRSHTSPLSSHTLHVHADSHT